MIVFQVCDNDAVDNLEPNYGITVPPTPINEPDPEGPATDGSSGSSNIVVPTSSIVLLFDEDDSSGSGNGIVLPVTASPPTCTKLYGELLPVNNYLVMFSYNSPDVNMENLYKLMQDVKKVDPNFDTKKIKPMLQGSKRGFYYNGLSQCAVMKVRAHFLLAMQQSYTLDSMLCYLTWVAKTCNYMTFIQ